MSIVSAKHEYIDSFVIALDGGLNLYNSPTNLEDNELQEALNVFYRNQESSLTTRSGIVRLDSSSHSTTSVRLAVYREDSTTKHLVIASNGVLYSVNESTGALTSIGSLGGSSYAPSMVTFGGKLIIASGGTTLQSWDGTTLSSIADSPQYATCLEVISNRLASNCNAVGNKDTIYLSDLYDPTDWDTATDAIAIPVGYLDGLDVTAIKALGTDLLVFKDGAEKRIYRLSTAGTTDDWYTQALATNSSATNSASACVTHNDVIYSDDLGIKSIVNVQEYGDLAISFLGKRINPDLNGKDVKELKFSPTLGILFCLYEGTDQVYIYHPHNGAFTRWEMPVGFNSVVDTGDYVYLAGSDGYIYKLSTNDFDTVGSDTYEIETKIVTKAFSFSKESIIRKSRMYYDNITTNSGDISVRGRDGTTETVLFEWEPQYAGYLYDANEYLYDADEYLYGDAIGYVDTLARYRDQVVAYVLNLSEGRIKIKSILVELATVNG